MSHQKQHHYVPKFYLDRFADTAGHVWAFDKSTDSTFCARPEKLAREGGFYDAPFLQGTAVDPAFFERGLADLEAEAARIMSSWIRLIEAGGWKVTISEVARGTISTYIAVQSLRTAEQRVVLSQLTVLGSSMPDLQSFHVGILFEELLVQEVAQAIGECIWTFGRNDTGLPFYTSDHPVVVRVHPKRRCIHPLQLPNKGVEVMLPLSPTLMLYGYERSYFSSAEKYDGHVSPVQFTSVLVKSENVCQVGHSKRFVFCNRNAFEYARAFCADHSAVRNSNRNRFLP